jgi:WS/DGAT/MGAT family acyltransferase
MSAHAMGHADAAWLRMDRPANLMVINSVLWFEESPDWAAVKRAFTERIVDRFPRFRQRASAGGLVSGPAWHDDEDFDPELHFHHVALPAPHDRGALQTLVADLAARPLDPSRPLWDVHLVDDYGSGAALVVRIHHAIADGIALTRVLLSATDAPSDDGDPRHGNPLIREIAGAVASAVRHPHDTAERAWRDAHTLAKLADPRGEASRALRGKPHIAHRVGWSAPVDLWRIKAVGRAFETTVNDVLVSALAGALNRHLRMEGAALADVHALVPVNLRPLDAPLPADLGNRFGLVLLALPLSVDDPVERLLETQARMQAIKRSDEAPLAYGILDLMGRTPAPVERRLVDYFTAKGSLVLTNVPGPRRRLALAGTPVAGVLVWAPCSGSLRMSVSLFSYAGKVTAGFLVDAGLLDDPEQLARAFRAEVLALYRLAQPVTQRAAR